MYIYIYIYMYIYIYTYIYIYQYINKMSNYNHINTNYTIIFIEYNLLR